jgi:hypothetical protein
MCSSFVFSSQGLFSSTYYYLYARIYHCISEHHPNTHNNRYGLRRRLRGVHEVLRVRAAESRRWLAQLYTAETVTGQNGPVCCQCTAEQSI